PSPLPHTTPRADPPTREGHRWPGDAHERSETTPASIRFRQALRRAESLPSPGPISDGSRRLRPESGAPADTAAHRLSAEPVQPALRLRGGRRDLPLAAAAPSTHRHEQREQEQAPEQPDDDPTHACDPAGKGDSTAAQDAA